MMYSVIIYLIMLNAVSGFRQHTINVYYVKQIFILRNCVIQMIHVFKN